MCTDINHCQAWKSSDDTDTYKKIAWLVEQTTGQVATCNNEVINAVYHAASGGFTENAVNVWNGEEVTYLQAVESNGEKEVMKNFETIVEVPKDSFYEKTNTSKKSKIQILNRTESQRVIEIKIGNKKFSGNEIRQMFNLRSSNFEIINDDKMIKFIVRGYGHGVGLSQWGAQAMAIAGKSYEEIIKHYYTGVQIINIFV